MHEHNDQLKRRYQKGFRSLKGRDVTGDPTFIFWINKPTNNGASVHAIALWLLRMRIGVIKLSIITNLTAYVHFKFVF